MDVVMTVLLGTLAALLMLHLALTTVSGPSPSARHLRSAVSSLRQSKDPIHRAMQAKTITTTNCDTSRLEPYPFELQLIYEYSVEADAESTIILDDLEKAIAHTVANELYMCDGLGQPLFSVEATAQHSFSKTEFCAPTVDIQNTCQVVIGTTSILAFDDSAFVRMEADRAVENGLRNGVFFEVFAGFVVRTEYRGPISEALLYSSTVAEPDDNPNLSPVTTTVAVAASSLAFFVATIFCYGVIRKDPTRHPEPSIRHQRNRYRSKLVSRTVISGSRGVSFNNARKHNFVRLEELVTSQVHSSESASDDEDSDIEHIPTMTWSISDITSDSASIVSRSASMLERIEEETEDEKCMDYDGRYLECIDDGYDADSFGSGSSSISGLKSIREVDEVEESIESCQCLEEETTVMGSGIADFDCVAERYDQVIDVSDLDGVVTVDCKEHDSSKHGSLIVTDRTTLHATNAVLAGDERSPDLDMDLATGSTRSSAGTATSQQKDRTDSSFLDSELEENANCIEKRLKCDKDLAPKPVDVDDEQGSACSPPESFSERKDEQSLLGIDDGADHTSILAMTNSDVVNVSTSMNSSSVTV